MLTRGDISYTWTRGRKLSGVNNGKEIRYFYDHTGSRVKKVVDGVTTEYRMAGDLLVSETADGQTVWYMYDSGANLVSMVFGGKNYFYIRNLQNDVIALIDEDGNEVVHYTYDSWGKILSITGSLKDTIGQQNPFRYRGYFYDRETGMYYLKSRYYDPELKRFISSDNLVVTGTILEGLNLFSYCSNNPVNCIDPTGHFWDKIFNFVGNVVNETINIITGVLKPVYSMAGGASLVDGILPVGDIVGGIAAGIATGVAVSAGIYLTLKPKKKTAERIVEVTTDLLKQKKYSYWTAGLVKVGRKTIIGGGIPLSPKQASGRVASGGSIICRNQAAAQYIIFVNGYANAVGPEKHKNDYFSHYHPTRNHKGYESIHIWYFG